MNVCDYCGAVYNDTCGGCEEPHVILCRHPANFSVTVFKKPTRYDAEAHLERCSPFINFQVDIVPLSLWVEAIENLLDWRP